MSLSLPYSQIKKREKDVALLKNHQEMFGNDGGNATGRGVTRFIS